MMRWFAAAALLALAGCTGGARDVDYPPDRGISADVAAGMPQGASSLFPGVNVGAGGVAPLGVLPWQIGERRE